MNDVNKMNPLNQMEIGKKPTITLNYEKEGQALRLNSGFYIVAAPTLRGKTFSMMCLAASFPDIAEMYTIYPEPRGVKMSRNALEKQIKSHLIKGKYSKRIFIIDSMFLFLAIPHIPSDILSPEDKDDNSKISTTTFKGGLQPVHALELANWQSFAAQNEITICGILNESLFPIGDLEGVCEGRIEPATFGQIMLRDRTARGQMRMFKFSNEALAAAADKAQETDIRQTLVTNWNIRL